MPLTYSQALMGVVYSAPCFLMAARLLRVWRDPMAVEDGKWINLGVGVFVAEFIILQSGAYLGHEAAKASSGMDLWGPVGLLTFFYGLFAAAISLAFRSRMLFYSFVWVLAARYVALAIGISAQAKAMIVANSIIGGCLYFALVVLSVFLPWPRWGISEEIAARSRQPGASGLWVDQPHRAIGAATVYFALLGLAELLLLSWIDPRVLVPR